jgi:hypothetical protein
MAIDRPHGSRAAPERLPDGFGDLLILMSQMEALVDRLAASLSPARRRMVPNAVLNLAVNRLVRAEGNRRAATILYRLSELVANGSEPQGQNAFPLTRHDA